MPKVYAPQQPSKFDQSTKLWIPTMDLTPAEAFGELIIILPNGVSRMQTAPLVTVIKEKMQDYRHEDWLLCVGDPSLIAAAACVAAKTTGGILRLLKWDKRLASYTSTEMKV